MNRLQMLQENFRRMREDAQDRAAERREAAQNARDEAEEQSLESDTGSAMGKNILDPVSRGWATPPPVLALSAAQAPPPVAPVAPLDDAAHHMMEGGSAMADDLSPPAMPENGDSSRGMA